MLGVRQTKLSLTSCINKSRLVCFTDGLFPVLLNNKKKKSTSFG